MDLLIFLIPDPAILSISGPISDLHIVSVHPYLLKRCIYVSLLTCDDVVRFMLALSSLVSHKALFATKTYFKP